MLNELGLKKISALIGKLPICKNLSADTETDNGFSYWPIPILNRSYSMLGIMYIVGRNYV